MRRSALQARRVASFSCSRSCSRSGCAIVASSASSLLSSSRRMIVASRAASVAVAARLTRRRSRCDRVNVATSSSSDRNRRPVVRTSCKRFSLGLQMNRRRARSNAWRSLRMVCASHFIARGRSCAAGSTGVFPPTFAKEEFRREIEAPARPRRRARAIALGARGNPCRRHLVLLFAPDREQRRNDRRLFYEARWHVTWGCERIPTTTATRRKCCRASAQRGSLRCGRGGCRSAQRHQSDSVSAGDPRFERGR